MSGQRKSSMEFHENVLLTIGLLQLGLGAIWGGFQQIVIFSGNQVRRDEAEVEMNIYVSLTMAEEKRDGRVLTPGAARFGCQFDHSTTFYSYIQIRQ